MAKFLTGHPFFLLTISGIFWGWAAALLIRRKARRHGGFARRGRSSEYALAAAVVAVAIIMPALGGEGGAAALSRPIAAGATVVGAFVVTVLFLLARWWGKVILTLLIVGVIVPPLFLWPTVSSFLHSPSDEIDVRLTHLEGGDYPFHELSTGIALIRVSRGVSDVLHVSLLPLNGELSYRPEYSDPSREEVPGPWPSVATIPLEGRVEFALVVTDVPPCLWWLPPAGTPLFLSVADRTVLFRYHPSDLRFRLLSVLRRAGAVQTRAYGAALPVGDDIFIQPGTYALEVGTGPHLPGSTDR